MAVIKPSLPKGTRDFLPEQMILRQQVFDTIRSIFERYGYLPLETPSIEKLEVLSGKYGDEGERLIFKVLKRGTGLEDLLRGESRFVVERYQDLVEEALRYDLTVPLSRVVAMYQRDLVFPFKRYQIQPVWRADRPQRGRYREFYQCDVDTVGTGSMLADAETIAIVFDVLTSLGFKNFKIRMNNRKILNGIMQHAGISRERANQVFVAIDKLDKIGLDGVKSELADRGLTAKESRDILQVFELTGSPASMLSQLRTSFSGIPDIDSGAAELQEIVDFLTDLGVPPDFYQIDLFLVRGLGYYTGPIHESVVQEPKIGSLSGGGRYDHLIGMFLGRDIPAVGTAFGIERIIDVMTQQQMAPEIKSKTQVLVAVFDEATRGASLQLTQELRRSGLNVENFVELAKLKKQFTYADRKNIPFLVILGPDEVAANQVTVKDMQSGKQERVARAGCVRYLQEKLASLPK